MAHNNIIIEKLNAVLSERFPDYRGAYFFGSRVTGNFTPESDYDVILIFDSIDDAKQEEISGVFSELTYKLDVYFDYKLLTSSGTKSIEYIRKHKNPVFIQQAVDAGVYYART